METYISNLAGDVRTVQWDGREYLVAPLSMIVPGVLNGSNGPLLYPESEINRDPDPWNNMPIVVNHPTKDGAPISARSPEVLEEFGIGVVFNATAAGFLGAEGWFDVKKTMSVAPNILVNLRAGKPIELSTGLFTDNIPARNGAQYEGRPYTATARNLRPDHLAILTSDRGACSVADGCGVNVVNEEGKQWYEFVTNCVCQRDDPWYTLVSKKRPWYTLVN